VSIGAELGQYILQKQFKKILKIQWEEEFEYSGYAGDLPKATARVDSRLKLTFGQLVSKSTHHV